MNQGTVQKKTDRRPRRLKTAALAASAPAAAEGRRAIRGPYPGKRDLPGRRVAGSARQGENKAHGRRNNGGPQAVETALRESEERYRILLEAAPIGIGLSTMDGKVLGFNRRLCEIAGMTLEEALQSSADSFYVRKGDRKRLLFGLQTRGSVNGEEVLYRRKDGTQLRCIVSMQLVRLAGRQVVMTILQDVTRQKKAEHYLQGLVALLSVFAAKASRRGCLDAVVRLLRTWCQCQCVGIRLFDSGGLMPYAAQIGFKRPYVRHENACKTTGSSCACARALVGKPRPGDLRVFQGSFFCDSAVRFARQIESRRRIQTASRIACVQTGYRSLAHAPIRYNGVLIGTIHLADLRPGRFTPEIINYVESVAPLVGEAIQRFEVEESLLESENRFRALFELYTDAKLLIDPSSRQVIDANPAAVTFYGYDRAQLCGMRLDDLAELAAPATGELVQRLLGAKEGPLTMPHRLASGEKRLVEVHSSPITVGRQRMLYLILHDVTERRRLEQEVVDISERERQRVGQDLHDTVGSKLTGVALIAKALAQRLHTAGLQDAELAEEVVRCVNESIAQTRSIARGLCPVELSVSGLTSALNELALEQERLTGVKCRFQTEPGLQVQSSFAASHLFRMAQEAVTNALRHGSPTQVLIRLLRSAANLCLEIQDDGTGFKAPQSGQSGMGIRSMRYRANVIGAQLTIGPGPAGGTLVSCLVPARGLTDNQMELWQQS